MKLRRRALIPILVLTLLLTATHQPRASGGNSDPAAPSARLVETWKRHGLDPNTPLEARINEPVEEVYQRINHFRRPAVNPLIIKPPRSWRSKPPRPETLRGPTPSVHVLTDAERDQLRAAVALLPPRHRRILRDRLHAFNFIDAMVVGGTISTINPGEPDKLYDIAINANVFSQTASEWLTRKERSVVWSSGSPLDVWIDVGPDLDALAYVLLHEATHVVDDLESLSFQPLPNLLTRLAGRLRPRTQGELPSNPFLDDEPLNRPVRNPFLDGVWGDYWQLDARYADPKRSRIEFYAPDRAIAPTEMPAIYASLAATPLASLYSERNPMEDLAEFASLYHLTQILKLPYRIVVGIEGVEIWVFEPMKSDLVRSRFAVMTRFYE